MNEELEMIVARGVYKAVKSDDQAQKRRIVAAVTAEIEEHADEVRVLMDHLVWGTVR